jgi:hypothetical protein
MALEFRTGRGLYRLASAAPPETADEAVVLTLGLERADGIERVVFRCRIGCELLDHDACANPESLIARIAPWLEREFEATREAALKSIRSERRLYEVVFDAAHRGPF